ncbi:MAG: HlyD family efflux transporter periplasmic adaptor subunit [Flavobacteriaceae bacterium]|nr:HlyD family efflux transporter periplasmic adaptor subunit [Flavobacteriaceae bacterium]
MTYLKKRFRIIKSIVSLPIILFLVSCGNKKETTIPQSKTIIDAVFASGSVAFSDEYWVTANTEGFILKSYVKEGDSVAIYQNLFQLSGEVQLLQSDNARTNYEDALRNANSNSPQIAQQRNKVQQAEEALNLDKKNYERYTRLIKSNAVSQLDYDNAKLQYKNSKANLHIQKEVLNDLKNQLALKVKSTKNQLDIQDEYVSDYSIKSSTEGTVLEISKNTGELAKKGELLARVGSGTLVAKLFVAEEDIRKVELNQKTTLSLNTDNQRTYDAVVSKIYPTFNTTEQSFEIEVCFVNDIPKLFSGTQVQANIVFEERKNALIIPTNYLTENNTVLLENGDEKPVVIGVKNSNWVEIKSGLNNTTTIAMPTNK